VRCDTHSVRPEGVLFPPHLQATARAFRRGGQGRPLGALGSSSARLGRHTAARCRFSRPWAGGWLFRLSSAEACCVGRACTGTGPQELVEVYVRFAANSKQLLQIPRKRSVEEPRGVPPLVTLLSSQECVGKDWTEPRCHLHGLSAETSSQGRASHQLLNMGRSARKFRACSRCPRVSPAAGVAGPREQLQAQGHGPEGAGAAGDGGVTAPGQWLDQGSPLPAGPPQRARQGGTGLPGGRGADCPAASERAGARGHVGSSLMWARVCGSDACFLWRSLLTVPMWASESFSRWDWDAVLASPLRR
jgi:hypothetical protein